MTPDSGSITGPGSDGDATSEQRPARVDQLGWWVDLLTDVASTLLPPLDGTERPWCPACRERYPKAPLDLRDGLVRPLVAAEFPDEVNLDPDGSDGNLWRPATALPLAVFTGVHELAGAADWFTGVAQDFVAGRCDVCGWGYPSTIRHAVSDLTRNWLVPRALMPGIGLSVWDYDRILAAMRSPVPVPAGWHGLGRGVQATDVLAAHTRRDGPRERCGPCLRYTPVPDGNPVLRRIIPPREHGDRAAFLRAVSLLLNVPDPQVALLAVRAGLSPAEARRGWQRATRAGTMSRWCEELETLAALAQT